MDAVDDPLTTEVWVMKSAQIGWTEILNNIMGKAIDVDPCPILLIQPTLDMAEAWAKDRLKPMIRDTPNLKAKVKDSRDRDSGSTTLHKVFPGGHATMAGANAPASLASRPIRLLLFDETDRFPVSAGKEGDPIKLATKRTTTFWNRKIVGGSTPTVAGQSRIERAFKGTDQRYYMVPCPHDGCGHVQRMVWKNVRWPKGHPEKAVYVCPECGAEIDDRDKALMIRRGEWVATKPFKGKAGFHISEMYSPWVTFAQMAIGFIEAKAAGPEILQVWINTSLGEVWKEAGEAPPWKAVQERKMPYSSGEVPAGAIALTCGVDVQKNRLVYGVRAWGLNQTSWLIEEREMFGDTDQPFVWNKLGALLADTWGVEKLPIRLMLVDSGYRASMVYDFCRRYPQARPIKGWKERPTPISTAQLEITRNGKKVRAGIAIWHLDTNHFKTWVHGRINWPIDQPGAWMIHQDTTDGYCKQVVAESKRVLANGRIDWIVSGDNHFLDVEMMNAAASEMLQIHRMTQDDIDRHHAELKEQSRARQDVRDDWINEDETDNWI